MSTNKTKNMKMHSWAANDVVRKEEQNENFQLLDSEFGQRGVNIRWKGANAAGTSGSYSALLSAVSDESDAIYIPKGIYLIERNITIPSTKRLVFDRNARLRPAQGVTIIVNGTIDAGIYDWIFDISLGGFIQGLPLVGNVCPHWFGAKGDATTDDTAAFRAAMAICNKKYRLFIPQGHYRIRQTIDNNSRGMYGVAAYVDDQQEGSILIWDPVDITKDLLPCIKIETAGIDALFENFSIQGRVDYNSQYLSKWINKSLFEKDSYGMFATGAAAIMVEGAAKPVFRNIRTDRVKVGLLLDSTEGHVTSYDCNWRGLIGLYCRKNSEDYFIQGGNITGAFCGIMFGVTMYANHYGGFAVTMKRVHLGFAPYSIYQVIDSSDYNGNIQVNGLTGMLETVRMEQAGEAAIKLLPNSLSTGLFISGFAMSWSRIDYADPTDWQYALPDDLKSPVDKQKYAIVLGRVLNSTFEALEGVAYQSPAVGAKGSAYIEFLEADVVLTGLNPEYTIIKSKNIRTSLLFTTPLSVGSALHAKAHNALSHGNLLENPEQLNKWSIISGTGSLVANLTDLPVPLTQEMKLYVDKTLGNILKVTPDGVNKPFLKIPFLSSPFVMDTNRFIGFEYFILSPSPRFRSRLEFGSGATLYDETFEVTANKWTKISCKDIKAPNSSSSGASFFELSATQPTYLAAVMVSYDYNGAYSPHNHPYSKEAIESGDSFILTDKTTGSRCKIELIAGKLQVTTLN
ncbi:MAG: hypothetical protein ACE3L7_22555 [Candidatus Pristimantibacillus sp.]